ncbi:MAG: xanthine dehydrogenase family protein molybdopterin-binding subunit [Sphingomonadaceae bacterium]|nr:xanthine dehydrogenase family protein molybdopterin-binding subunit [Sphingomonadaceae bacterium]
MKTAVDIGRRGFLAGGAGLGLIVAWSLWPRDYRAVLNVAPGETALGGYLKIGEDGHVAVAVPQTEMGQGVYTGLPQILADELGADWRTIAVEPAPIGSLYANRLLARELAGTWPRVAGRVGEFADDMLADRAPLVMTAGSTSVRAFEAPLREAGARARALLCMAAAKRWGIDWQACDTEAGFVVRGTDRLRFGEIAVEAARLKPPHALTLRLRDERKLAGQPLPRLDTAAKLDGSAQYAGDVRLPGMVFASLRQGPVGETRLVASDKAAAARVRGAIAVIEAERWVAALGENWWAADRAAEALAPRFATRGKLVADAAIAAALDRAMASEGRRVHAHGSLPDALPIAAEYAVGFAAHAAIEPLVATARLAGGRLEIWAPTQAPAQLRAAAAAALAMNESAVTVYPMFGGGGFGRKLETDAAVQAAILSARSRRPVQLMWSRGEECAHDRMRPPARARLAGALDGHGGVAAWRADIAAPAAVHETMARLGLSWLGGPASAVAGALPAYDVPALAIDYRRAEVGVSTGVWRSDAHSYTAFFTESFVDELAAAASVDPLTFRLRMLRETPRLAACLKAAAAMAGWQGGHKGGAQGLACYSAFGSHIALIAEAGVTADQDVKVGRVFAAVDCGTVVNPDLVGQQIEGGIVFALGAAIGAEPGYAGGFAGPRRLGALGLPRLADCPDIEVQLIPSEAPPGGVAELAVPPLAPAVANALFTATGQRYRSLPFRIGA